MTRGQTPSQTVGPFFAYGLTPEQFRYPFRGTASNVIAKAATDGVHIRLEGQVFDGKGDPVPDAMIEIWQANAHGRYNHPEDDRKDNLLDPDFAGFGRVGTDTDGRYWFDTVKPGPIGDGQAPHINVIVFMRGILSHAYTRIYFADEAALNAEDPVLARVGPARQATLVAGRDETPGGVVYRFDIRMQGENETVFFDV